MASGKIELGLSDEMQALLSTRVFGCRAVNCKNNAMTPGPGPKGIFCRLQNVEIGEGGHCLSFERYEADNE